MKKKVARLHLTREIYAVRRRYSTFHSDVRACGHKWFMRGEIESAYCILHFVYLRFLPYLRFMAHEVGAVVQRTRDLVSTRLMDPWGPVFAIKAFLCQALFPDAEVSFVRD